MSKLTTVSGYALVTLSALAVGCGEADESTVVGSHQEALTDGSLQLVATVISSWSDGYCVSFQLKNNDPSNTATNWSFTAHLGSSVLQTTWGSTWSGDTGSVTVGPASWNGSVAPGQEHQFGFCAQQPIPAVPFPVSDLTSSLSQPTSVELRISDIDDYVAVSVNGIQRDSFYLGDPRDGQLLDITDWFGGSSSDIEFWGINTGGPASYRAELWVNGSLVLNDGCLPGSCGGQETKIGLVQPLSVTIQTPSLPARQPVQINGSGKVYLDDRYTGITAPTTLELASGTYAVGVGVSGDTPPEYTGRYHEEVITVANAPVTVDSTTLTPLPVQEQTRLVVLPIRYSINYSSQAGGPDESNTGYLTNENVDTLVSQILATNETWFQPFTYGLGEWTVATAPMTDIPIYESNPDGIDTTRFDADAASVLAPLREQYDMIVYFFSQCRADGTPVDDGLGIVWAFGGRNIGFTVGCSATANEPNVYFLHEVFHNYEGYQHSVLHEYNGIDGLHGATFHGYPFGGNNEPDFVHFYRNWIRGQVAETLSMTKTDAPAIPTDGDLWVGPFQVMRHGYVPYE